MVTMLLLFLVYEASSFVDTTGMANAYHASIFFIFFLFNFFYFLLL